MSRTIMVAGQGSESDLDHQWSTEDLLPTAPAAPVEEFDRCENVDIDSAASILTRGIKREVSETARTPSIQAEPIDRRLSANSAVLERFDEIETDDENELQTELEQLLRVTEGEPDEVEIVEPLGDQGIDEGREHLEFIQGSLQLGEWSEADLGPAISELDDALQLDPDQLVDCDQLLDFETLAEFDKTARQRAIAVETEVVPRAERHGQLARALGRRHGWTEPQDLAVLERLLEPQLAIGRTISALEDLLSAGIEPSELEATHRLRLIWPQFASWIDSGQRHSAAWRHTALSWFQSWKISAALGPSMDEDELAFTLDRMHSEWFDQYREQLLGRASGFSVGDSFRSFLVERLVDNSTDLPLWAEERWIRAAHHRAAEDEESRSDAAMDPPWL